MKRLILIVVLGSFLAGCGQPRESHVVPPMPATSAPAIASPTAP